MRQHSSYLDEIRISRYFFRKNVTFRKMSLYQINYLNIYVLCIYLVSHLSIAPEN